MTPGERIRHIRKVLTLLNNVSVTPKLKLSFRVPPEIIAGICEELLFLEDMSVLHRDYQLSGTRNTLESSPNRFPHDR